MNLFKITLFGLIWPALIWAQDHSKADSASNVLDDVVVQMKYKGPFEEDKLPLDLNFDYSQEAVIKNRVNWKSIGDRDHDKTVAELNALLPLHFSQPQYAQIKPAPVKSFHTKFEKLQRWQLDITNSDGSLFRRIAGQGNPPANLSWDGLGDNNDPLLAGENYAYSFTAVDQAGNRRTFPGNSFQIAAFSLQLGDSLLIGLGDKTLFNNAGLRLLSGAIDFAREVATLIRLHPGNREVQVAWGNIAGEKFLQMLADELVVPQSYFNRIKPDKNAFGGIVFYLIPK